MPRARKRFGQHFLTDPSVVDAITAILAVGRDDRVIEIGPGRGVLTAPLAAACDNLTVIEVDRDLAATLRRRFPRVNVIEADVLRTDFAPLAGDDVRVVGNLPYNIAAPIMIGLFADCANGLPLRDAHFMLQAEMADRLAAEPGTRARGRLAVIAQYHCRVEPLLKVGPSAFSPPPTVNSTRLPRPSLPPSSPQGRQCMRSIRVDRLSAFCMRTAASVPSPPRMRPGPPES